MKIVVKKISHKECVYTIARADGTEEVIELDSKTYLLHDMCHFAVEKELAYRNGFWGMLAQGYAFHELFGKENMLTTELRFIEKVVGPVQSAYLGQVPRGRFPSLLSYLDYEFGMERLDNCLNEIGRIMDEWGGLSFGQYLTLEW